MCRVIGDKLAFYAFWLVIVVEVLDASDHKSGVGTALLPTTGCRQPREQ
jgi:hypothetical protein